MSFDVSHPLWTWRSGLQSQDPPPPDGCWWKRERERLTLREGDKEEDTLTHPEVREGLGRTLIHQKNSLKTVNVAPEHTYHL